MTCSARLDFDIQRNEDFGPFAFVLRDPAGAVLDLHDWTLSLAIAPAPGRSTTTLQIGQFPNGNGSFVDVADPDAGEVEIFIAREDMFILAGPADSWVSFAHNLIGSDELGYQHVVARGLFTVAPGV